MRVGLRGKIIFITALTPLILGVATLVTVHRSVREHVDGSSIHESLDHSVRVLEYMLAARSRALSGGADVIARDPRFFSLITLGEYQRDRQFKATVRGMAADFNRITETDVFEVVDRRGRVLTSVGSEEVGAEAASPLVERARAGNRAVAVISIDGRQFQLCSTPVRADGQVVGVLLMGSEIGPNVARELRGQMRSEVTFIANGVITATTLPDNRDRTHLLEAIERADADGGAAQSNAFKVTGQDLTYITVVRRIPGSDPEQRQYFAMQRAFDPELAFLKKTQSDLGVLAALALIVAMLTGVLLSDQIRRPLQQLVHAAHEIQKGNYAYPLQVRSRDEIGFLTERFDDMRRREQLYVGSLEETMRIKSDFINIASHELRTPISVIDGYRALLTSGELGALEPRQQQALQAIGGSLDKLKRVAEQATSMADIRHERLIPDFQIQPLEPVIGRAIGRAIAALPGRQVTVEKHLDAAAGGAIEFDPRLVEQALTHLISNAIRFTPDGGRVDISLRRHGEYHDVEISDTGRGIPADRLASIFDHGYSVGSTLHHSSSGEHSDADGGLGLGLGITRGIVEAHGGTIEAANRPEGGARFTIRLPGRSDRRQAA